MNPLQNQSTWEKVQQILASEWELKSDLHKTDNYFQKLKAFRDFYLKEEAYILDTFKKNPSLWAQSYPVDWSQYLSPIEQEAWISIRSKGKIVMYPQYPVLNYHLDFGNPGYKIGLEIDGKNFHNKHRDAVRDKELKKAGWKIFRITGSEMVKTNYQELWQIQQDNLDYEDAVYELRNWLMNTGDGVIEAIRSRYFLYDREEDYDDEDNYRWNEIYREYQNLCAHTLSQHCYQ